ncbi:MAG: S8 family serine peptidase [Euryarchaeota archaeon]|nr:S8 family serine peptidase [Euryarchaeota archaeon]
MLILISGVVCSTSHAEDAYAAQMVNVSEDIPYDSWADAAYKETHDRQIENLTWGGIFNHSQERHERYACEYVEKCVDSANAIYKDVYGNRTNDNAEGVNPKHSIGGNIRMSVTDANNNRIEDCLEGSPMRTGIDAGAEVDVIVRYHKKSSGSSYSGSYSTLNTLNTLGARVKYNYKTIDATALKMPAGNLNALAEVPGVEMIYLDREVHALLDTSVPVIRGGQAPSTFGVSGADVTIAVIDTGIDASHESLDDPDDDPATDDEKVIAFEDFVNSQTDPYDNNGHGTQCAGIAAGTGGDSDYVGVAPMSKLVGVKVLDQYGHGSESDYIAGIEWCVLNKDVYGIDVISISWGTDMNGDGMSPIEIACDSAVDAGIVVCVAAGNLGPGSSTVGTPASAREMIAVGAIEDSMDIAYFSSRGPTTDDRIKSDVCAVGADVTAPAANSGGGYGTHSGTSMATPHVAGVAALLIEYNPYVTPSEVKDILHSISLDKGGMGPDNTYGWGVVDSVAALDNVSAIRITLDAGGPYDPGDRVTITGSISNRTIPISAVVNVTATSPDGLIVASDTATSDSEGNFSVDFILPDDSNPGDYKAEATASYGDETGRKIADFKVGTLIIGMNAPDIVIIGDPYLLEDYIRYDDGTPVSGADLNVTIKNLNGTSVYTDHISSNATGHFTIRWTPVEASMYTVLITARDATTLKAGLDTTTTFQAPCGIVTAAVLDSWGTDYNKSTIWDDLNKNWHGYGDYLINVNYTSLNKEDITYNDLDLCGADLLVISNAWDNGTWTGNNWEFSDSEIDAIDQYVGNGHGIIATAGTFGSWVGNNIKLAPLFGMADITGDTYKTSGNFTLYYPDHPIFLGLDDPYQSGSYITNYPWDTTTGSVLAMTDDRHSAIITNDITGTDQGYANIYLNHFPESSAGSNDAQLFYNAIVWTGIPHPKPDHDLGLSGFQYPDAVCCKMPVMFNVTLKNNGLNDEIDLVVNLTVDGVVLNSMDIASIAQGSTIPVHISWTPTSPGVHQISLSVTEVLGEDMTFNNLLSAGINVPVAGFSGEYSDCGTDTDGDGLYDYLTIEVGVNVGAAGNYAVSGELYDEYGSWIDYEGSDYMYLSVGSQSLPLKFSGVAIGQGEVNGTYDLAYLCLYDDDWNQLDFAYDAYTTPHYNYTEFQRPPAEFSDLYSDHGTDTDGDGLYDYLTIEIGVDVTTSGYYCVYGELGNSYGDYIEYISNCTYLNTGDQTIRLDFSGVTIGQGEVNGTYDLTYLCLYDDDPDPLDFAYDAYTTSYYNYTEFQRPLAEFSDRYSDHGTDTDGNELYDYLTIEIGVDVPTSGYYCVDGELSHSYGNYIEYRRNCTYLNTGDQTIQLDFSGVAIRQDEVNGTYDLTDLCLYDDDWNRLDVTYDAYTTSYYNYTEFQRLPAEFGDRYSDHGTDTDGNGLYDHLTIEIGVDVTTAGYYCVDGELGDRYGGSNRTYLNTGDQTIQLDFSGVAIRQDEVNGTYDLTYLRLCDDDQNLLDFVCDAYTTSYYNYTEFGDSIHDAYLGDVNHDGGVTPADATIALELAASGGWDPAADVDHDNQITSLDALMILQAAAGTITL